MVIAVTPSAHLVKPHRRRRAHLGPASVFPLRSGAEPGVRWACHTHLCHPPSPSASPRRQQDGLTHPQLPAPPSHPPRRQRDGLPHHRGLLLPPSQRVVDVEAAASFVCGDGRRGGTGGRARGRGTTASCPLTDAGRGRQRRGTPASCPSTDADGRRQRRGTPASCPSADADGRRQRRAAHVSCSSEDANGRRQRRGTPASCRTADTVGRRRRRCTPASCSPTDANGRRQRRGTAGRCGCPFFSSLDLSVDAGTCRGSHLSETALNARTRRQVNSRRPWPLAAARHV